MDNNLILYTTDDGQSQLVLRELGGQVWLTQLEMAELYQTSKQNISKHVKAILSDGELAEGAVVNSKLTTAADGKDCSIGRISRKQMEQIAHKHYEAFHLQRSRQEALAEDKKELKELERLEQRLNQKRKQTK